MRATWYVLEDGSTVDPSEVSPNKEGRLAHKSGLVAMRSPDCPRTRSVDVDTTAPAKEPPTPPADEGKKTEEMKPAPKPQHSQQRDGYKTRGR